MQLPAFQPQLGLRGRHRQTIVGAYLQGRLRPYAARRHYITLDDGDQLVIHDDWPGDDLPMGSPSGWEPGERVCVLVHGLGGAHNTGYLPRVGQKLNDVHVRTFRMDLRGCGAGLGRAQQIGHAGRSEDVAAVLARVAELCPGSPISVVAFSLGANITLKLLGEQADDMPRQVDSVLAVAPPIDLIACAANIQSGFSTIYDRSFARGLWRQWQRYRAAVGTPPVAIRVGARVPRRLWDFDDWITAPLAGFDGAEHYYQEASSAPLLRRITLPTQILVAADDPLIPVSMFERADISATTTLLVTPHGGHMGYVGVGGVDPDRRWLDWRIVDWVRHQDSERIASASSKLVGDST